MEKVSFRFTGGLAEEHELNFYEFGRFQYGAARFIYTVENFRQDGVVLQKLTKRVRTDIRVHAPKDGSFIQEVLIKVAPKVAECVVQCSFTAVFTYIWDRILPSSKAKDIALQLSIQETAREHERSIQAGYNLEAFKIMKDVVASHGATTGQALAVLDHAIEKGIVTINDDDTLIDYRAVKAELSAEIERKRIISENSEVLNNIDQKTAKKITSQVRKAFSDMAKPLKSSATMMEIYGGNSEENIRIASIDENTARQISSEVEDEMITRVRGTIKSADRETSNGQLRYLGLGKPLSFRMRQTYKEELLPKVLDAMKSDRDDVWLTMYLVRDPYGTPVRAILEDVEIDEEDDISPF